MITTRRWILPILSLMVAPGLAGCRKSTFGEPVSTTSVTVTSEPGVVRTATAGEGAIDVTNAGSQLPDRHGGVAILIAAALSSMDFTGPNKAEIDRLAAALREDTRPADAAWERFIGVLADGVAAGHVDRTMLQAAEADLEESVKTLHERTATTLSMLHEQLSRHQRLVLVDKVDARWEAWRTLQSDTPPARRRNVAVLQRDLGLTPQQTTLISGKLQPDLRAQAYEAKVDEHLRELERAFLRDSFDARTLDGERDANIAMVAWRADRIAQLYVAAAPVLTPDQRRKLANDLRRRVGSSD